MTFPSQSQKRDRFSEKETCPVLFSRNSQESADFNIISIELAATEK